MKFKSLLAALFIFAITGASSQVPPPTVDTKSIIFIKVEEEAQFPGGVTGWAEYLRKNLKVTVPTKNHAPVGSYRVVVKFIVSKDGTVSNVQAETSLGYGMEKEVIRVIEKGPNWIPARQNGFVVTAYRTQPVIFMVSEE